ncbi:MAG: MDR family MFS transporter [Microbacterium sp.]|uniref:MDR family MFS transporter n=1 Tax=Microbacterium sp. TaxID=51671 RepID=UPI0039E4B3B5
MAATPNDSSSRMDPGLIRLGLILVVGIFMSMLDTTIVNVALPSIGREMDADLPTLQWVVTGYMLALAVVIPTTGWLVNRIGAKRLFILSTALFTVASGLCALAWNPESLIAFRIVQGAGGALLMPVAQTILAKAAGPDRMGRTMTVVGVPALLAPVLGPIVGGLMVDSLPWQWIFVLNLPIGVASVILSARMLPTDHGSSEQARFDILGLALIGPGLALALYGLTRASSLGTFTTAEAWIPLALGALLVIGYIPYAARRGLDALIPIGYFRDRAFASSAAVSLVVGLTVQSVLLLLTLYYQQGRGETALVTGVLLIPQGIGTAIAMPIGGKLTDTFGPRVVVVTGMILSTLSAIPFALADTHSPYWLLAVALFVRGLGFGATMMPAMAAGYRTLPKEAAGHASSALQILSRVGGALGAAIMIIILTGYLHSDGPDHAYGTTFWWAAALGLVGTVLALLLPCPAPDARRDLDDAPNAVNAS